MSTVNESGYRTFQATAVAIAKNIRVTLDSNGLISASGAANDWIGTTLEDVLASGYTTVRLKTTPGTHFFTASAAITRGNKLYPTASGKVDDAGTTGGCIGFVAVEAATADGDIIECAPIDAAGTVALGDGENLALGTTTGTKIGTSASQKLGLWNATPVVQPSSANQTAVTDSTGGSVADAIAAVVTAPTALTDNGGGTADATVASMAAVAALTVSDGAGTNDGTIGAITGDASVIAAVQELAAKIGEIITWQTTVQNNFKELTTRQSENRAAIVALTDGLAKGLELTNQIRADLVTIGAIKGSA